jgi:hypothetical protein
VAVAVVAKVLFLVESEMLAEVVGAANVLVSCFLPKIYPQLLL